MTAGAVVRRLLILPALAVVGLALGVLGSQPQTAQAADLSSFDPGMIISDSIFYDSGALSVAQVQTFLSSKGAGCVATSGNTCLKDFRQTTPTRAADDRCTGAYTGASNETAAQIITKVAVACGINPQVLIVTLQKEQGLITATAGRSAAVYQKAMGYGCPDTAPCDSLYYGFFNQVYNAAHQFKNYAARPTSYAHRAGMVNQVRYHPTASCGTSSVYIQNQATANLYNYTPYQPNAAALAAGYGTGDSCSSYGNRNFWNYFTDWFGSTTQRAPIGSLDIADSPAVGQIRVGGWALDPDTTASISVHVYVDGKAAQAVTASTNRPDIAAAYGKGAAHGFAATVGASAGRHEVCVYAIDSAGGPNTRFGCATVTVVNQVPIGSLDSVTSQSTNSIRVAGWALDPDTTASVPVHVYVDGEAVQAVTANGSRPDVGRAHGKGDAHGFSATVPTSSGTHEVCVYAIDSSGGTNPQLGCRSVTVNNKLPVGSVDIAESVKGQLRVAGWALDPDTTASIAVHVYVDGKAVKAVTADRNRTDVDASYGKGAAHGYDVVVDAAAGQRRVCVYAVDATGGPNPTLACRDVTIVNTPPAGNIDTVVSGVGELTVAGWALDPDTTDSVQVRVSVDGTVASTLTAGTSRPDVGRAYGRGDAHGFRTTFTAQAGTREVCIATDDTWGGGARTVACRTVEVNGLPFGSIDVVSASSSGIRVGGWALDPNTTAPIDVHVRIDGSLVAAVRADLERSDVATAFGQGADHGFDKLFAGPSAGTAWSSGSHTVCVYGIDDVRMDNPLLAPCRTVTVP